MITVRLKKIIIPKIRHIFALICIILLEMKPVVLFLVLFEVLISLPISSCDENEYVAYLGSYNSKCGNDCSSYIPKYIEMYNNA